MATVVNGTTYYPYGFQAAFVPAEGQPEGTFQFSIGDPFEVTKEDKVTPMVPLSTSANDPLPLVTVAPGGLPEMLLPELEGWARVNGGTWFPITSDEVPDLIAELVTVRDAALAAATRATEARQAAEAAQAAAEAAAAGSGGGGGTAGGLYVVRAVNGAYPTTEADALSAAAAAGPQPYFIGPLDVAPPSWISDGDPIGLTPTTAP